MIIFLIKIQIAGAKLTLGKCSLQPLTCVIGSGRLLSLILILTVPLDT